MAATKTTPNPVARVDVADVFSSAALDVREDNARTSARQVLRAQLHAAMTPERILALAARPEGFRVSWQHRDQWIVHRCAKLVRAGRLRRIRRHEKGAYFYGAAVEVAS